MSDHHDFNLPPLCTLTLATLRGVFRTDVGASHYLLVFKSHAAGESHLGPLAEYAARVELARLGLAPADIDARLENAPVMRSVPGPPTLTDPADHAAGVR